MTRVAVVGAGLAGLVVALVGFLGTVAVENPQGLQLRLATGAEGGCALSNPEVLEQAPTVQAMPSWSGYWQSLSTSHTLLVQGLPSLHSASFAA